MALGATTVIGGLLLTTKAAIASNAHYDNATKHHPAQQEEKMIKQGGNERKHMSIGMSCAVVESWNRICVYAYMHYSFIILFYFLEF